MGLNALVGSGDSCGKTRGSLRAVKAVASIILKSETSVSLAKGSSGISVGQPVLWQWRDSENPQFKRKTLELKPDLPRMWFAIGHAVLNDVVTVTRMVLLRQDDVDRVPFTGRIVGHHAQAIQLLVLAPGARSAARRTSRPPWEGDRRPGSSWSESENRAARCFDRWGPSDVDEHSAVAVLWGVLWPAVFDVQTVVLVRARGEKVTNRLAGDCEHTAVRDVAYRGDVGCGGCDQLKASEVLAVVEFRWDGRGRRAKRK